MYWPPLIPLLPKVLAADQFVKLDTKQSLNSAIANIHLSFDRDVDEPLSFTYGSCSSHNPQEAHHDVARVLAGSKQDRLIWRIPGDAPNTACLSAWNDKR